MSRTLTARWRRRITHTSLTVAALTMTASLLAPIATADQVTQDDIDKSKDQEQTTSGSIADLEVQISQLSADRDTAQISAQSANEDYLQALDELDTATTEAKTAEQNAVDAAAATETARSGLGSVVVATYQEAGNPLDFLTPFLTSDSLADLTEARVVLTRAGESSIAEVQNVEALQAVADTMQEIANDKVVEKKTASTEAEKTRTDAETAAQNAVKAVTEAEDRRTDLISQLAQQRNTTVELETQYQDQLEADRRAREEAAAREALQQQAASAHSSAGSQSADQQPARALGMPFGLIVREIVLPQALARTVQPLVNVFISCLIGSALAAAIGVHELTYATQQLNLHYAEAVFTFLLSGLTYLALAFGATRLGGLLERRLAGGQEVRA